MLGRRSAAAAAAVVALFTVTAQAQQQAQQSAGGSACPAGKFLYNLSMGGQPQTITMTHPSIASGTNISAPCRNASLLGKSMLDGSGSGTKGFVLKCANGVVQLAGMNCQGDLGSSTGSTGSNSGSSGSSSMFGAGSRTGGIGPVCAEENWPDVDGKLVCGDCRVLVDSFDSYYKTCDGYCQSMGMACAGAWEESNDECTVLYNMTCGQAIQSSDAICECKKGTGVVVTPPCSGDMDSNWRSGGPVQSCKANASLCQDDAPVVALGAKKGWFQRECCATCGAAAVSSGSGSGLKTCLDVKKEYQKQNCCGMPTKSFDWNVTGSKQRRLSQRRDLVDAVLATLEEAKMQGGAAHAASMATQLIDMTQKFSDNEA